MYNFPSNPFVGDIVNFPSSSQQYTWTGYAWEGAPLGQQFVTSSASASYSDTASLAYNSLNADTASWANNFLTSSVTSASHAITSSFAITASYSIVNFVTSSVTSSVSASYSSTASLAYTAILAQTASLAATASVARLALSSSYAVTASYVQLAPGSQVLFSTTGSWNIPVGNSVQSFTVDPGSTYTMWLYGNIPNGIIAWNATATISNTNVPVVGVQYCWVYTGGGTPLNITSIPDQFVGTSGSIMRSPGGGGITLPTNTFRFGISNTSGASQTVYYGFTKL